MPLSTLAQASPRIFLLLFIVSFHNDALNLNSQNKNHHRLFGHHGSWRKLVLHKSVSEEKWSVFGFRKTYWKMKCEFLNECGINGKNQETAPTFRLLLIRSHTWRRHGVYWIGVHSPNNAAWNSQDLNLVINLYEKNRYLLCC